MTCVCSGICPGYKWYQVRSGFMVENANASGHVFRKLRLGTKGNCEENPWHAGRYNSSGPNNHMRRLAGNLEVARRFLVYKGRATKDRQTTRLQTDVQTNRRYIVNRPIDKSCIDKSRIKILLLVVPSTWRRRPIHLTFNIT
jgi:hypothetical protein